MRLAVVLVFTFLCFSAEFTKLPGNLHPKAVPANDIGPADPTMRIGYVSVILQRTPAQQSALDALLADQQNPASPNFHHWLTPEQFGERFGASAADISRISTWLKSQGLHIETVARGRDWIACSGTVTQFQSAFRTSIRRYRVDGEEHFANSTALSVPSEFSKLIQLVRGLNDFNPKPGAARKAHADFTNSAGNHYLAPDDWATIYDVAPLYKLGFNGTGMRLVVIGTSDFKQTDITQFQTLYNLPAPGVQGIPIEKHLGGVDPGISTVTQGEANLDLEWTSAIARNATIVYDYAKSLYDAVQDAIDNARAPVMTMSFGGCDATDGDLVYYRSIYALKANSMGMTWLASSGDSGPANCDAHASTSAVKGLSANFPASIPEVTAVGGTQFNETAGVPYWSNSNSTTLSSVLGYIPEMVWNESGATGLWSSGGGPSAIFAKPPWQVGPGIPLDGARDTPDIALTAANHDGYRVVLNGDATYIFSGTSASTPSFAGVVTILNQYLVSKGIQSTPGLGNINPTLYSMWQKTPIAFHDITVGSNVIACKAGTPDCSTGTYGYLATPGYDFVTGMGSIDAYNLVTNWKSVATPAASSFVTASVAPNPVYQTPPDSQGAIFNFDVVLTESNGGQTTLTSFTYNGSNFTSQINSYFGSNIIPANGTLVASRIYTALKVPVTIPLVFGGMDPSGKTWTTSTSVQFLPAQTTNGPQITAVANGASFQTTFAPGMQMSIFGTQLATSTASASTLPLPETLGGSSVTVNGLIAPFYYASPGQLNVQIPYYTATGSGTVAVTANGQTDNFPFTVAATAPGIYADGNSALVPTSTAARNSVVSLYMTGTGVQNPAIQTGAAPGPTTPFTQYPQPIAGYSVTVGGVTAPLTFFGIPAYLVGVSQANFQIPANTPLGVQPVVVTVGGVKSAAVKLTITQ